MDEQDNSIMVALLPKSSDWCKLELPHTTIVYGGEVDSSKPTMFNELAKLALNVAENTSELLVKVTGVSTLGDDEKVAVLLLEETEELLRLRTLFEKWDDSGFPTYKPHATIGPEGTPVDPVPMYLEFDRLAVVWGDRILTFKLKLQR